VTDLGKGALRLLLVTAAVVGLSASPAGASHGGVWHWPSSNRTLEVTDILVHYIPAALRPAWREYRDAALADWASIGVVSFSVSENRTKKQQQWDGVCLGRGATKPTGAKDFMICRHGDWAVQAAPRYATTCNVHDADYPRRCQLEPGGLVAINEGFAALHPKYVKHEIGHMLGLHAERFCPDISVMSYCDGSTIIDQHDIDMVVWAHSQDG
jgi:hypothetical protein